MNPTDQFLIKPLLGEAHAVGTDMPFYTFTNSSLMMVLAVVLGFGLLYLGISKAKLVPSRGQSVVELVYTFVADMLRDNVGKEGMKYFPFIFTLFVFVTFGNVMGLFPYAFTFTSHIAVTAGLALFIFIAVTIIGFAKHGTHYFRMFYPHGAPLATAPILIPIEVISYLSRPLSLSVRLFANMTAGHIMLKVLAMFIIMIGGVGSIIPFAVVGGVTVLEIGIAFLQAYVFTILSCIYLNDAINMH